MEVITSESNQGNREKINFYQRFKLMLKHLEANKMVRYNLKYDLMILFFSIKLPNTPYKILVY
ncbi:MAG: hypothetical protein SWX82_04630 [Cyanobacteriota bacterium]|nr:hypothetical protein [Cyanobacteriota bacterium]